MEEPLSCKISNDQLYWYHAESKDVGANQPIEAAPKITLTKVLGGILVPMHRLKCLRGALDIKS